MGVRIDCDRKEVLDVKNVTLESLHAKIMDIIDDEKLALNDTLREVLERMDQTIYGFGCIDLDIANFIRKKDDIKVLAHLVKRGIEAINWTMPAAKETVDHLWEFHAELLKYGEKLR